MTKSSSQLTKEDVQFLIWALGFIDGKITDDPGKLSQERVQEIVSTCKRIWPKLSEISEML